jgi:hypothetical protein
MKSEFGDDFKWTLRRYTENQLVEGQIFGYLAFDDDAPIG